MQPSLPQKLKSLNFVLWGLAALVFFGAQGLPLFAEDRGAGPLFTRRLQILSMVALAGALLMPIVLAALDGRVKSAVMLVLGTWAGLALQIFLMSSTVSWQRDDGLGTGFAIVLSGIVAFWYPVAVGALLVVRGLILRFLEWRAVREPPY